MKWSKEKRPVRWRLDVINSMESHGGRSLETPRGVAVAPAEQRATPGFNNQLPLDVRECGGEDGIFYRIGSCGRGGGQVPPTAPRRPDVPVRVHTRPQMAIVTQPPPQTCVLQPITSSGPIRTTNLVRSSSRTTSSSSGLRRNISDFAPVTIPDRNNFSTISSSSGRLENAIPSTPVLNGRTQYSNSLTNSASSRRTGSVNSSVVETVSLTLPRPETERTSNEYVETPLRTGLSLIEPKLEPSPHRTIRTPSGITGGETIQRDSSNFAMVTLPVTNFDRNNKHGERSSQRHHHGEKKVITTQPSATFKKERIPSESQCSRQNDDFIICSECKKCRCESCRTPRPLPSTWLCGTCHCSAETVVDYTTCLCCAKAFFYHCCNDETVTYADDPCSCSPDGWYTRFGCLSIMSIFLPCLFLYWPCRGLVNLCESCHQYASSQGCRCQKLHQQPAPLNFEKRLLDSPE